MQICFGGDFNLQPRVERGLAEVAGQGIELLGNALQRPLQTDQWPKCRYCDGLNVVQSVVVEIDNGDLFCTADFIKTQGYGRATIADMLLFGYHLGLVQMTQGDVVGCRKCRRRKGCQRTDVKLTHRLAQLAADGGQVASGNNGQGAVGHFLCLSVDGLVVISNGLLQGLLFTLTTLSGLTFQHIPRAYVGDGADHCPRLAITVVQYPHLLFRVFADATDHKGVQAGQQLFCLVQRGHGIVVAADHDQLPAGGVLQVDNKAAVESAGVAWRGAGIKNIAGNDQCIYPLRLYQCHQPVKKGLVFGFTAFAQKVLAQVPV